MKISPERLDELIAEYDYRSSAFPYHVETESALRNFREARKLLAEAGPYVLQIARACAECDGTAVLRGEHGFEEVCPDCDEIRDLLSRIKAITP